MERLHLNINIDKTKITHSTQDKALFLGYQICCSPLKNIRIGYNAKGKLVRHNTRAILLVPIARPSPRCTVGNSSTGRDFSRSSPRGVPASRTQSAYSTISCTPSCAYSTIFTSRTRMRRWIRSFPSVMRDTSYGMCYDGQR